MQFDLRLLNFYDKINFFLRKIKFVYIFETDLTVKIFFSLITSAKIN